MNAGTKSSRNPIAQKLKKLQEGKVKVEILDTWVENGFINAEQREAIAELIADEKDVSYDSGYDSGYYSNGDYDAGWDEGYEAAKAQFEETMRDTWFDQGYEAALAEHGIEE